MPPHLWIDVEDMFEYARGNPRPSGIQRLAFEIYQDLQARHGGSGLVDFVRHDTVRNSFSVTSWDELARLFAGLTHASATPAEAAPAGRMVAVDQAGGIRPHARVRQLARVLVYRLPLSLRPHAIRVARSQVAALRAWFGLADALARGAVRTPQRLRAAWRFRRQRRDYLAVTGGPGPVALGGATGAPVLFTDLVRPGDILLSLGSPWSHPDYGSLLHRHRDKFGMRVAVLIYDLIPLRRPEFCDRNLVRLFRAWFEGTLPACDAVFAISDATARDVEHYAIEHGDRLPGRVMTLPIGTGFSDPPAEADDATAPLPAARYALVVSTIEARKNHLLLFRVWRRLLEELPRDQVPTLVFAGRVGWMVDDLMRMIANTNNLDGKLVIIENPGDAELRALYRGCLFSMFPSFYEGWGLPVTESLALGKPCLIADRTSLPEAGGHLARRFDPDNLHDAYRVIRDTIADPDGLAAWEAQVRREFRPVSWSETVERLLTGLGHPLARGAGSEGGDGQGSGSFVKNTKKRSSVVCGEEFR